MVYLDLPFATWIRVTPHSDLVEKITPLSASVKDIASHSGFVENVNLPSVKDFAQGDFALPAASGIDRSLNKIYTAYISAFPTNTLHSDICLVL